MVTCSERIPKDIFNKWYSLLKSTNTARFTTNPHVGSTEVYVTYTIDSEEYADFSNHWNVVLEHFNQKPKKVSLITRFLNWVKQKNNS